MKVAMLTVALLVVQAGYGQLLKVGIEGFKKEGFLQVTNKNGPLFIKTHEAGRFSVGLYVSYEKGNNGVQAGWATFPYRADRLYKNFFSDFSEPSEINLFSVLYRRRVFHVPTRRFSVYLLGGAGVGRYENDHLLYSGPGSVTLNGVAFYTDRFKLAIPYDRSYVILPTLKAELECGIFSRFLLSATLSYTFRNMFFYDKPLEKSIYSYNYYGQQGGGEITNYGSGYQVGLNLKYQINLRRRSDWPLYH